MIDAVIKGVTDIANDRMRKAYPLLDKHYCEEEVKIVCEAFYELSKKMMLHETDNQLAISKRIEAEFGNMITGVFNE